MVSGVEDLRTPLSCILDLESQIRGTIAGFMTPNFIVTLPNGGGKRLACSYETYDRLTGLSRFRAPVTVKTRLVSGSTGIRCGVCRRVKRVRSRTGRRWKGR